MANTAPVFANLPQAEWTNGVLAANTNLDGTGTLGTDIFLVFTGAAISGSFLQTIIANPRGTNVASVLRIFLNNGATNATASNNVKIGEIPLPATTASATAALAAPSWGWNKPIPPGYRILVTLGTAVAGGYAVSAHGGSLAT